MRFPSPRAKPGYGKRACQFIDCVAGVVFTELARPGGVVALATSLGGWAPQPAGGTRPPWVANQRRFFDVFSDA